MLKRLRGRARIAVAGGLVVMLIVGLTAVYAVVSPQRALGAQATLTILTGTVELRDAADGSFTSAADGGLLGPGATVRTAADGNAIITFFDGSTVTIEPSSELTLEQLETTSDGNMLISILQTVGRSWHVVGHKLTDGSQYQVRTPTATASVRGTKFEFGVDDVGKGQALTAEGLVQLASQGQIVDVGADQVAEAPANEPPGEPIPAPPPENVVKVILDPTSSAAAVDSKGRAVSLVGGVPNVTVPRGKVEFVDGKIILTVPTEATERVSTVVKADDPTKAVAIQTQVESKGVIVGNTLEVRAPDETGTAKGGVAVTSNGVIVLPDTEAKQFGLPKIAAPPPVAGGGGVFGGGAPVFPGVTPLPNVPVVPTFTFAPGATPPTTFALPEGVTLPPDVKVGEFKGGFQQFSFFGFTQDITKQPGFDATKATGLEFAANGVAAPPQGFNYATFNGALPPGLVPPPPPGATDVQNAAGFAPPPGFSFRPAELPAPGAAGAPPFDPASIPTFNLPPEVQEQMAKQLAQFQQIATQLQQSGAFGAPAGAPTGPGAPGAPGTPIGSPPPGGFPQGGVGPSPFRGPQGQLPEGCRDLGFLGVVCNNVAPIAAPGIPGAPAGAPGSFPPGVPFGASPPPGFTGSFPPGQPFTGSFPPGAAPSGFAGSPPPGGFPALPPCAPGQLPSPTNPCAQTAGAGGTPTCPPGTTPGGAGACVGPLPPPPSGAFVAPPPGGTFAAPPPGGTVCAPPSVPLGDGRCGPPPSFAPAGTFPTGTFATCLPPLVTLPDGKCGPAPTFVSGPTPGTCLPPLVILPDGRCGTAPTGSFTPPPTFGTPPPTFGTPPPTFGTPPPTFGTPPPTFGTPPPTFNATPPPTFNATPPPTFNATPPAGATPP